MRAIAALMVSCVAFTAGAADKHLGVATCAGSACHGAVKMSGSPVRQDEYLLWERQDAHSRAFAALRTDRARRIAGNLGFGDPTTVRDCLVCHADAVPEKERGGRFQLSDGVGCEACHGGAERWLASHVQGYTSNDAREKAGFYPTWNPQPRAELCLSCHQGNAERPMTHAIMGAGHPPLLFELDTFCALQPAHNDVDADYIKRKGKPDGARNWAVGQAVAARGLLAGVDGLGNALVPELVWFDCNACHHSLQAFRWQKDPSTALPPGRVRLADASLFLLSQWLDVVKPDLGSRWRNEIRALHQSTQATRDELRARAQSAQKLLESDVLPLTASHEHTRAELARVTLALLDAAAGARSGDFSVAEQSAMASAVFLTALEDGGETPKGVKAGLDAIYAAVENRDRFDPAALREALSKTRDEVAKAYPAK